MNVFFVSFVLVLSESASIFTAATHLFIFSIGKIKLKIIVKIMVMIVMFVSNVNQILNWLHLCHCLFDFFIEDIFAKYLLCTCGKPQRLIVLSLTICSAHKVDDTNLKIKR